MKSIDTLTAYLDSVDAERAAGAAFDQSGCDVLLAKFDHLLNASITAWHAALDDGWTKRELCLALAERIPEWRERLEAYANR